VHVVADTNTVISGLLWHGPPRQVLDAARTGTLALSTSAALLAELAEVLQRPKFAERLARANVTPYTLVWGMQHSRGWSSPHQLSLSSKQTRMMTRYWHVQLRPALR